MICKYVVHPNRHGFRFFFETENRFFLGGIVEARAEHKNFLTKYHWSFCSNVQMFKIFKMFKMLCAKQESFFAQEKKGWNQMVFNIFSMPIFDEFNYWYIFFQCQSFMNLIIGTILRLFIDYLDFKSYKSRIIIKGL